MLGYSVLGPNSDISYMGMLDRYKKTKGGFGQLLQLIETSPVRKKEQFLTLIAEENPVWEEQLRKKILSIEKIYGWDGQVLSEVFSRIPPLTLAVALFGTPTEEVDKLLSCLPPISKRKITDVIAEVNPSSAEKATCLMKIISEVRGFVSQGIIKLEKIDPDLHIPENFEDILSNMTAGFSPDLTMSKIGVSPEGEASKKVEPAEKLHPSPEIVNGGQDVELLRKKMTLLMTEVTTLKQENLALKEKLAQIKKIA